MMRKFALLSVALLLVVLSGCDLIKKVLPGTKVIQVNGKLTFEDNSLFPVGTRLVFTPKGKTDYAYATTNADGTFIVYKFKEKTAGAEEGDYIVLVRAPDTGSPGFYKKIPGAYYNEGALSASVKEGMPALDFKVPKVESK